MSKSSLWLFFLLCEIFSFSGANGGVGDGDPSVTEFTTGTDRGYTAIQSKTSDGSVVSARIVSATQRGVVITEENVRVGEKIFSLANIWGVGVDERIDILRITFGCLVKRTIWLGTDHWEEYHSGICVATLTKDRQGIPGKDIRMVFENATNWAEGTQIISPRSSYPDLNINEQDVLVARETYSPKIGIVRFALPNGGELDETIIAFNAKCESISGEVFGQCLVVTACFGNDDATPCSSVEVISERTTLNGVSFNFGRMPWNWKWNTGTVPGSPHDGWDSPVVNILTPEYRVVVSLDALFHPYRPGQEFFYYFKVKTAE